MFKSDAHLPTAAAERLRALLGHLNPEELVAPADFVMDGFPCTAVVLRKGAPTLRIEMNLAGLPRESREHPRVQLVTLVLDAASKVRGGEHRR